MKTEILRIRIEPELKDWVKQQGNSSNYVRKLIEEDKDFQNYLNNKNEKEEKNI